MDKKQDKDDIKIKQINPRRELNDLEKTVILQFEMEEKEKALSKTMQFKILNTKQKEITEELPKPKLTDTIRLKISDIKRKMEEDTSLDLPKEKKSLYNTVVLKLEELINKKNALAVLESIKVVKIEPIVTKKVINNKKAKKKVSIEEDSFSNYVLDLQKIAIKTLEKDKKIKIRKYNSLEDHKKINPVNVSKENYAEEQKKLSQYATNNLYYKYALKEKKSYKLYRFTIFASLLVCLLSGGLILRWYLQGQKINNLSDNLKEETPIVEIDDGNLYNIEDPIIEEPSLYWKYLNTPLSSVDLTSLIEQNKDTIGYLIVNNTNINYPVVQTTNNSYYLTHAFDKSSNYAGWVFADYRDNFTVLSDNTVIYAHGRKDKVMFGSLVDTLNPSWYKKEENQLIQLSTLKYNTMWQIFSIYKIEEESYYITTDFLTRASFQTFIDTMKERSIYDFNVDVKDNDKLLTLSTCYNDNGIRLVVQAKLVKIQDR